MKTGFVWHELYMWHDTGTLSGLMAPGYPIQPGVPYESPETKRRFKNLLDASGLSKELTWLEPREASETELQYVHTPGYLSRLKGLSDSGGGSAGTNANFGRGSYEIAALAAGGALTGVTAVIEGQVQNAYALIRPAGHHAEPDKGMGFCMFNNGAIAAIHALEHHGLERVAIVDWDVHYGNGAHKIFDERSDVLTISLHQENWIPPGPSTVEDNGTGEGAGHNINIPLPPGSGSGAYYAAFTDVVLPALSRFKPELIIVPCGFDSCVFDPLASMLMHSDGFRELTKMIMGAAADLCDDRLILIHEGGYSVPYVPLAGLAVVEQLCGVRTDVKDELLDLLVNMGGQELQPHQSEAITRAAERIKNI